MSNSTRPDFAQKLLNDLKMRKERMISRGSTNMSSDAYGSSRRSHKNSTEMKSHTKVTSNTTNTAKMQRASSGSQISRKNTESSNMNMIVPYGGGNRSNQPLDLSMTLSYALDDNGKLKKMNLTGSNAMIGFLKQISKRTMDFGNADSSGRSSKIQWPSSGQFPTLTNLHIDEVSKGAQRLNQILKSFYNGVNSNGCSVDLGKELLKGTMELEESLRMLVSLQEASEYMVVPQRKSRVKLLEMGEENDQGKGEKVVKKPVFSFDKRAKNEKPASKVSDHRRSASCGADQLKNPPLKSPNVVAKLMGLEEIPRGEKMMTFGVSRSEFGDEDGWIIGSHSAIQERGMSNKIVILTSKKIEQQRESDERKQMKRKEDNGVKKAVSKDNANLEQGKRVIKDQKSKTLARKNEVREKVIEISTPKDIHQVKSSQGRFSSQGHKKMVLQEVKFESSISTKEIKSQANESNFLKMEANKKSEEAIQKANEVSAKLAKSASRPSKGMKQRQPVNRGSQQPNNIAVRSKEIDQPSSYTGDELQNILQSLSNQHVKLEPPCDELDQSLPQTNEFQYSGHKKMVLQEVKFESSVSTKEEYSSRNSLKIQKAKSGPDQKANEVMAKLAKSASRPSKAMKQQATILQGLKQRQPVNKGSQQPNTIASKQESHELQRCEDLENIPQILSNQDVNLELPCDELDQPLPQTNELVQSSNTREVRSHIHREKAELPKLEKQQPLTDEEIYLKQILITSQVFLNTAEALFKLNIPIGILNANDMICQEEKDAKQVIDCAYEMLKTKGKRQELVFYPCKNANIGNIKMRSLDDLVRQLHKDFKNLRSYGKTENSEFDQVEYLLKMMERDIFHKDMDVNCMWEIGWNENLFAYIEMDEVVRDVEKFMLNELLDDVLEGFMEICPHITAC